MGQCTKHAISWGVKYDKPFFYSFFNLSDMFSCDIVFVYSHMVLYLPFSSMVLLYIYFCSFWMFLALNSVL